MNAGGTPIYGLDIETDTTCDGLDPRVAAIVAIAVSASAGDLVFDGEEADLLARTDAHLATLEPGVIATWNGAGFDLPFVAYRAARLRIRLGLDISADPTLSLRGVPLMGIESGCRAAWYAHGHLDAYRLYRADTARVLGIGARLKVLARAAGLSPIEVDAARIHELSAKEVAAYVASDAQCTRLLVERRLPSALLAVDRFPRPNQLRSPVARADVPTPPPVRSRPTPDHARTAPPSSARVAPVPATEAH